MLTCLTSSKILLQVMNCVEWNRYDGSMLTAIDTIVYKFRWLSTRKPVNPFENTAPRRKQALALVTKWCPSSFLAFSRRSQYILKLYTCQDKETIRTLNTMRWSTVPQHQHRSKQCLTKYVMPLGFFGRSNCDIAFDTCATQRGRNHLESFVSLAIHQNIIKPPLDTFHV